MQPVRPEHTHEYVIVHPGNDHSNSIEKIESNMAVSGFLLYVEVKQW